MISVNFALFTNTPLGFPLFSHALCFSSDLKKKKQNLHDSCSLEFVQFTDTFQELQCPLCKCGGMDQGHVYSQEVLDFNFFLAFDSHASIPSEFCFLHHYSSKTQTLNVLVVGVGG